VQIFTLSALMVQISSVSGCNGNPDGVELWPEV
jgi:hypothetical protein